MRISDGSSDVCSSDLDRLGESLMEMAKIGATAKGGCARLALTDLDKQGRDLFVQWCKEAGCTVTVDRMGNIFARRPGKNKDLPPVVTGSHLDTQPTGGKRSEEHTSELQSLMRISYAVYCLKKKIHTISKLS